MARCLTCSDGITLPGLNHCARCHQPTPTPRTPISTTEAHRRQLIDTERQILGTIANARGAQLDHMKARIQQLRSELFAAGITRLCRDEDCPECGWPETYAEVCFEDAPPAARAFGCSHCGARLDPQAVTA